MFISSGFSPSSEMLILMKLTAAILFWRDYTMKRRLKEEELVLCGVI